ncbi:hypothetical protein D3C73_1658490 [compost metagenome]
MYDIGAPAAKTVLLGQQCASVGTDTVAFLLERLHQPCDPDFGLLLQFSHKHDLLPGQELAVLADLLAGQRLV